MSSASLPCSTRKSSTVSCRSKPLPTRTSVVSVLEKNNAPSATASATRQAMAATPLAGRKPLHCSPDGSGTTTRLRLNSTPLPRPASCSGTTTPAGNLKLSIRQSPLRVTGTAKSTATAASPARSATRSYT